jgi:hypothetical protein
LDTGPIGLDIVVISSFDGNSARLFVG